MGIADTMKQNADKLGAGVKQAWRHVTMKPALAAAAMKGMDKQSPLDERTQKAMDLASDYIDAMKSGDFATFIKKVANAISCDFELENPKKKQDFEADEESDDDLYQILGVKRDASADEIRLAYMQKAYQYSQISNPTTEQKQQFKQVQSAFKILSDPQKRSAYDQQNPDAGTSASNSDPAAQTSQGHDSDRQLTT